MHEQSQSCASFYIYMQSTHTYIHTYALTYIHTYIQPCQHFSNRDFWRILIMQLPFVYAHIPSVYVCMYVWVLCAFNSLYCMHQLNIRMCMYFCMYVCACMWLVSLYTSSEHVYIYIYIHVYPYTYLYIYTYIRV